MKVCQKCGLDFEPRSNSARFCGSRAEKIGCAWDNRMAVKHRANVGYYQKRKSDPDFIRKMREAHDRWAATHTPKKYARKTDKPFFLFKGKIEFYSLPARPFVIRCKPMKEPKQRIPRKNHSHTRHRSLQRLLRQPKPVLELPKFSPEIQEILDAEAEKQRAIALKRRQLIYGY